MFSSIASSDAFTVLWLGHLITNRYFAFKDTKPKAGEEIVLFFVLAFGSFIFDVNDIFLSLLAGVTCPMAISFWFKEEEIGFWERSLLKLRCLTIINLLLSIVIQWMESQKFDYIGLLYICMYMATCLVYVPVVCMSQLIKEENQEEEKTDDEMVDSEEEEEEEEDESDDVSTAEEMLSEGDTQDETDNENTEMQEEEEIDEKAKEVIENKKAESRFYDSEDSDIEILDFE